MNSVLAVKLSSSDTIYRMLHDYNYRKFGYDTSDRGKWSARDVFNLFTSFDNAVFGHRKFIVKDGKIFGKDTSSGFIAELISKSGRSTAKVSIMEPMEICVEYAVCTSCDGYVRTSGGARVLGGGCCYPFNVTFCSTYMVETGGGSGGSGGWTGTGGGTGGSSGGGGGDDGWYGGGDDPCEGNGSVQRISGEAPIETCGSGWEPAEDRDPNGFLYSRINDLISELRNNKNFLIPCNFLQNANLIPCDFLSQFQYMGTFVPPIEIKNRLDQLLTDYANNHIQQTYPTVVLPSVYPFYLQTLAAASGNTVNMDYFPIHITQMPRINQIEMTPDQLFDYFRKHINEFLDQTIATFEPYNDGYTNDSQLWNSSNPLTAMLHLDMAKDGTVIVSQYQNNTNNANFLVSTLETPLDNNHPLGGNRKWGIEIDTRNGGYLFYTTAVDRIFTDWLELGDWFKKRLSGTSGFEDADKLWRTLQDKMIKFVLDNGGQAGKYLGNEIIARPQWNDVKDFLTGTITKQEMRRRMGCN